MALHREFEGGPPLRPQPVERLGGRFERRETSVQIATGTLACPSCDAPVLPAPGGASPSDPLACGFCSHASAVRDFLALGEPTRPTRVSVRIRGLVLG